MLGMRDEDCLTLSYNELQIFKEIKALVVLDLVKVLGQYIVWRLYL